MSAANLDIIVQLAGNAERDVAKLSNEVDGLGKTGSRTGGILSQALSFAGGTLISGGITKGFSALFGVIQGGIGDAREAAQVFAQSEAVIKSTGGAAGVTAQQVADFSASLSAAAGKSLFGDSQIAESENLLLTFTNLKGGVLEAATAISVDMAQALGGAPADAAVQLGKALNDPIAGISALSRVGVTFTDQQKEQIKTMVEAGDVAGAQGVILAELNKEFGGSAAAAAAADGGMAQFKDSMGELAESVGTMVLPALNSLMGLLNSPDIQAGIQAVVTGLVDGVGAAFTWLSETAVPALITGWQMIQPALAAVGEFITGTLLPVFQSLVAWFQGDGTTAVQAYVGFFTGVWDQIKGVIDTVVPAIQAVISTVFGAVAAFLSENSASIQAVISTAWETIQVVIQGAMAIINGIIVPAFTAIAGFIASHGAEIQAILQTAWNLISTIVTTALNVIQGVVRTVMALIKGDWSGAWEEIKGTAETLWNGIKSVIEIAINAVKGVIDAIMPTIVSVVGTTWETIKTAAAAAWEALRAAVAAKIGEVVAEAQAIPGKIVSALSGLAGSLIGIGKAAIQGLIDGIKSINVGGILAGIVSGAVNSAKAALGIKSPSKETRDQLGVPMGEGVVAGIEATQALMAQAFGNALTAAIDDGVPKARQSHEAVLVGFAGMVDALRDAGKAAGEVAVNGMGKLDEYIKDVLKDGNAMNKWLAHIPESTRSAVEHVGKLIAAGGEIGRATSNYFQAIMDDGDVLNDWLSHIPEDLRELVQDIGIELRDEMALEGSGLAQALVGGIEEELKIPEDKVKQIFGGKMRGLVDQAAAAGEEAGAAIVAGISRQLEKFEFGNIDMIFAPGANHQTPDRPTKGERRAIGGPVYSGSSYIVGERGPELFMPRQSGTIVPNNVIAGNTTVNITVIAQPGEDTRQLAALVADEIDRRNRLARLR